MAGQTFPIVPGVVTYQVLVRVVARNAADAWIGSGKALAVGQTIRLEANVGDTARMISYHRFPGAMALAAEVGDLLRGQLLQIRRRRIIDPFDGVEPMRAGSQVAMFAGNSRL